jgi:hypothetical protein
MPPWFRRLSVVLSIGGGFSGACLTLTSFFTSHDGGVWPVVLTLLFSTLFIASIFLGLSALDGAVRWRLWMLFYAIQIPRLVTSFVGFVFTSGFFAGATIGDNGLNFGIYVGSEWGISLFAVTKKYDYVGFNAFALVMLCLVLKYRGKTTVTVTAGMGGGEGNPPEQV